MADNLYDGDVSHLASDINQFFYSVSADLEPLDQSVVPETIESCPDEFIIEPYTVEKRLSAIKSHKSCGPEDTPNWF